MLPTRDSILNLKAHIDWKWEIGKSILSASENKKKTGIQYLYQTK